MYNNIGLRTARGSGTNGYIQRNLAYLARPKQEYIVGLKSRQPKRKNIGDQLKKIKYDNAILDHNNQKKIEIIVCKKRIELENQGKSENEIDEILDNYRKTLTIENIMNEKKIDDNTHMKSKKKMEKNEQFLRALGLKEDKNGEIIDVNEIRRNEKRKEIESKLTEIEKIERNLKNKNRNYLDRTWNSDIYDFKKRKYNNNNHMHNNNNNNNNMNNNENGHNNDRFNNNRHNNDRYNDDRHKYDRDRNKDREIDRERDRERYQDRNRNRYNDKYDNRYNNRDRDRERDRDRNRDRDRDRDRKRNDDKYYEHRDKDRTYRKRSRSNHKRSRSKSNHKHKQKKVSRSKSQEIMKDF